MNEPQTTIRPAELHIGEDVRRAALRAIGKPLTGSLAQRLYMINPEAARALKGKPVSAALLQRLFGPLAGNKTAPIPGYPTRTGRQQ